MAATCFLSRSARHGPKVYLAMQILLESNRVRTSGLYFRMPKRWQALRRRRMLEANFSIELVTELCGECNFREWFDRKLKVSV